MRKSLTRAVAGTAIAVVAVGAAATAASASTKPAKTATALSIAASSTSITGGSKETISGTLTAGSTDLGGQVVLLDEVVGKHLVPIRAGLTDGSKSKTPGAVSFTFTPFGTATYELAFRGTRKYAASDSGTVTVTVNKTATALSIAASATSIAGGSKETISGTLTAGSTDLGGQRVALDEVVGKKLVPIRFGRTDGSTSKTPGVVSFTFTPFSTATYELAYAGTDVYAASSSSSVTVTVTKTATTLTAAASSASITKGSKDTITGTLTAGSTAEANQLVFLYKQVTLKSGKKAWEPAQFRPAVTNSKGVATFTVKPGSSTTYEAVFYATLKLAGSTSGTVTVTVTS
jgi:hypothetical protein